MTAPVLRLWLRLDFAVNLVCFGSVHRKLTVPCLFASSSSQMGTNAEELKHLL